LISNILFASSEPGKCHLSTWPWHPP